MFILYLLWFAVQCIHHVTRMCAKMEEPADSTSLNTCVNAFQNTVDHSVRVSKPIDPDISVEAVNPIICIILNIEIL